MTTTIQVFEAAKHHKPLKATSVKGVKGEEGYGRLSDQDLKIFWRDQDRIEFTVYSYATPIAWFTQRNGWYVVKDSFSVTTTKHTNQARRILA